LRRSLFSKTLSSPAANLSQLILVATPQSLCNNSPSCWITKPTFAFDLTKPPAAFARQSEQVTACHPTDNAKNNVTQETKVPVFHHCSGQPTSHSADCEKNNQPVMSIVPPQFYR